MADTTADQPALVSMAQQFTGLPMKALIGGPLAAAAEANQKMALTQVDFLMDTCFEPITGSKGYKPIMIEMSVTRGTIQPAATPSDTPTISSTTSTISLPILTILPLNSLAVDDVTVNFTMEVKSSYSEDHSATSQQDSSAKGSFSAKVGIGWFSATVNGSVSSTSSSTTSDTSHYEKSNSASYTVNVHAGQLPLPPGVTTIIDAYTNAITPLVLPVPTPAPGP